MLIGELIATFTSWNTRHRAPATVGFYRARLKRFCEAYNARDLSFLTPLEIDEYLAPAGAGNRRGRMRGRTEKQINGFCHLLQFVLISCWRQDPPRAAVICVAHF